MAKPVDRSIFATIVIISGLVGFLYYRGQMPANQAIPESSQTVAEMEPRTNLALTEKELLIYLEQGSIAQASLITDRVTLSGHLRDGRTFSTVPLAGTIIPTLLAANVPLTFNPTVAKPGLIYFALIMTFLFFVINFLISLTRRNYAVNKSGFDTGMVDQPIKDARKDEAGQLTQIGFAAVAGIDEVKEELSEIVQYLKEPERFTCVGARMPRGVLLHGQPGTGKTLLAKAVAGEAGVPFFSMSGSGFVELFAGVGASRVRKLFAQAKKQAPCIIFIDEIDAIGRSRASGNYGNEERDQALNQLLVEMDGFDRSEMVVVIAATNRLDILDPALLRPGRFDRHVAVNLPGVHGREEILRLYTKDKPLAEDVDLKELASQTQGLAGADLANLANEAALLAARHAQTIIAAADFAAAMERIIAGHERRNFPLGAAEKKLVAYHESGHALIAKLLPGTAGVVQKISIVPRGSALGYVLQLPEEDKHLLTRSDLLQMVAVKLGGRAAEELIFGETTTGAQNDLQGATEIARRMVCEYGMSAEVGPVAVNSPAFPGQNFNPELAGRVDTAVRNIVETSFATAKALLARHQDLLHATAAALIEQEVLDAEGIDRLVRRYLPKGVIPPAA